ncbi:metal ABC transporter permease [Candidatus Finniella inopinata]|nr:metal ABC transporter permease [Candidatus Finniella inopinata]
MAMKESVLNLYNFLIVPWIAGIGLSVMTSGIGCILVWRRLSFFGDALAHSTLLGVALSLVLNVSLFWGVLAICIMVGLVLSYFPKQTQLGSDTALAILSYGSLAIGMVLMGKISAKPTDPASYLFGDILTVTFGDLAVIFVAASLVAVFLYYKWQPLLLITLNPDLAQAEGINLTLLERQLTVIVAITVAACLKFIGALLVPALLVIPPATAASFARSPKSMVVLTFFIALISISLGLFLSVQFNTASGAMIVVTALSLFLISRLKVYRS